MWELAVELCPGAMRCTWGGGKGGRPGPMVPHPSRVNQGGLPAGVTVSSQVYIEALDKRRGGGGGWFIANEVWGTTAHCQVQTISPVDSCPRYHNTILGDFLAGSVQRKVLKFSPKVDHFKCVLETNKHQLGQTWINVCHNPRITIIQWFYHGKCILSARRPSCESCC